MPKLIIRGLNEKTLAELRLRAARQGRSVEAEAAAAAILRSAPVPNPSPLKGSLAARIHRRVADLGGVDLEPPRRD